MTQWMMLASSNCSVTLFAVWPNGRVSRMVFWQCATVSSLKPLHEREGDFRALMARLEAAPITHRKSAVAGCAPLAVY